MKGFIDYNATKQKTLRKMQPDQFAQYANNIKRQTSAEEMFDINEFEFSADSSALETQVNQQERVKFVNKVPTDPLPVPTTRFSGSIRKTNLSLFSDPSALEAQVIQHTSTLSDNQENEVDELLRERFEDGPIVDSAAKNFMQRMKYNKMFKEKVQLRDPSSRTFNKLPAVDDPQVQYYISCQETNDLALPILDKVINKILVL